MLAGAWSWPTHLLLVLRTTCGLVQRSGHSNKSLKMLQCKTGLHLLYLDCSASVAKCLSFRWIIRCPCSCPDTPRRNISNWLPVHTTARPTKIEFWTAPLFQPQIVYKETYWCTTATKIGYVRGGIEENIGFWKWQNFVSDLSLCAQNAEQEVAQSLCVATDVSVVFSVALQASGNKVCSEVFGSETWMKQEGSSWWPLRSKQLLHWYGHPVLLGQWKAGFRIGWACGWNGETMNIYGNLEGEGMPVGPPVRKTEYIFSWWPLRWYVICRTNDSDLKTGVLCLMGAGIAQSV